MSDLAKHRVLIVDDEVAIRSLLDRIFRSAGYSVECGANGVEGLTRFQQSPADVVIVDRGMPEMNGEEMARQIKSTHPDVPLIMITGLPHLVKRPDLFSAVLPKPFRPAELMGVVARVVAAGTRSCG